MTRLIIFFFLLTAASSVKGAESPVVFDGTITKEQATRGELFHKSKQYLMLYAKHRKDIIADYNSGILFGKCQRKIYIKLSGITVDMMMNYTIQLTVSDEEIAYTVTEVNFESIPDPGYKSHITYAEDWMNDESTTEIKFTSIYQKYKMTTIVEVGEIIGEFSASL